MKALGRINAVESTIEDAVRRVARDSSRSIQSLALELGRQKERNGALNGEVLRLLAENERLRDELHVERQNRMLTDMDVAGNG